MKIISKIYINPLYVFVFFITIITGLFKEYILFTSIILFHELGHILAAIFYKWNIEKIVILPFGGITLFNEIINKSIKEEMVIAIMGPVFQIIYFILFYRFISTDLFFQYNILILIFNLLPVYPLDGSKILTLILESILSFKTSQIVSLVISYITLCFLILFFLYKYSFIYIIILIFIFFKLLDHTFKFKLIFNKFLLERYIYNLNLRKEKIIKDGKIYKMRKNYRHIFFTNDKYITENEYLRKKFDLSRIM